MDNLIPFKGSTIEKVFKAQMLLEQTSGKIGDVDFTKLNLLTIDHFSHGLYARELKIPKGCILVGKMHKYPQLNILAEGEIAVLVGDKVETLKAPCVINSPAGTKRIAKALENTTWITVHSTDKTDVDLIEQEFIAQTEEEYLEFLNKENSQLLLFG